MRSYFSLKLFAVFILLFLGLSFCLAKGEEKTASPKDSAAKIETPPKAGVEKTDSLAKDTTNLVALALDDFHQILAPLWHEAFPKKDFKSIREQAPLLQEKLLAIVRLKPPVDLPKEKLQSYLTQRQELAFYVSQVTLAAADTVDSALASAFEQMHKSYEELAKVFTVEIKELDSFHETLYFIWHKALPDSDYQAIKKTIPELKAKVDSLMKVSVPYGCKVKKEEFEKGKAALKDAVYQVADACEKGTNQKIDEALNLMHERFMELNSVLK